MGIDRLHPIADAALNGRKAIEVAGSSMARVRGQHPTGRADYSMSVFSKVPERDAVDCGPARTD